MSYIARLGPYSRSHYCKIKSGLHELGARLQKTYNTDRQKIMQGLVCQNCPLVFGIACQFTAPMSQCTAGSCGSNLPHLGCLGSGVQEEVEEQYKHILLQEVAAALRLEEEEERANKRKCLS